MYEMSYVLRIILLIVSILSIVFVLKKIAIENIKIAEAIYWILFFGVIIFLSIFPQVAVYFAEILQIESTANFVFLFFLFLLIIKIFLLSIKCSQLENKLMVLTQYLALHEKMGKGGGKVISLRI